MSGICGILNYNGLDVSQDDLTKMATAMKHRGPDGIHYYFNDQAGLANLIHFNTPESKFECQPWTFKRNNYLIVFQGRLDNREELYEVSELLSPLCKTVDSQLILSAYIRFGDKCTEKLLGDFSFVIWDNTQQHMFCGRDHMGVMPFYYYISANSQFFAFSSEIKGLMALPKIRMSINSNRIADYLCCVITDRESTFFSEIKRLPSGYQLIANQTGVKTYRYGKLKPFRQPYKKDSEFQEHFRSLFSDAIQCRLRSLNPVGSYLSGGLDSSAIVCVISALLQSNLSSPLRTFSSVFDKISECDEREYFDSVIQRYPHLHHPEVLDEHRPGSVFDSICQTEDEPFFAPFFISPWTLMKKANELNIGTLFDGHDGDSAISYGSGFLNELLLSGRFIRLIQECRSIGKNPSIKSTMRTLLRILLMCSYDKFQFTGLKSPSQKKYLRSINLLGKNFAETSQIQDRLVLECKRYAHQGSSEELIHLLGITHPRQQLVLEFFESQGAFFKLNLVYPFFDKRIIEFCLGLPADQKFGKGYNRRIVRDSLKDILPSRIRHRKSKTYFNSSLNNGFLNTDKTWFFFNLDTMHEAIYDYINVNNFREIYSRMVHTPKEARLDELGFLLRCLSLSKWLYRIESKIQL